ncbi:GNAT family N-acetyltransferase [Chloroflexota bacterium]
MTQDIYNENLRFNPITADNLPLLHRWLNASHVSRWWFMDDGSHNPTFEIVRDKWMKRIDSEEKVYCHIVSVDNESIAYIQWYKVSDFEESMALVSASNDTAGIDIFIGEPDYLYKGFGPVIISKYINEIIFKESDIRACIIDPEPENKAAIRAYEKVGFKYQYTTRDQQYGVDAYIMRLQRE